MDTNKIKQFYNSFKDRQTKVGVNKRHKAIIQHLINHGLRSDEQVLEIGCGIGTITGLMAEHIKDGKIIATDISDDSIKTAEKSLIDFTNIEYVAGSILDYNSDVQFDSIVMADVLEHIPIDDHKELFKKLDSLIKESGRIFINIPNPPYLEWCIRNIPEKLQIIDQPIHADILMEGLKGTSLNISQLMTYSVWVEEGDYRFIVIDKHRVFERVVDKT